jgi:hypothetical protein
LDATEDLGEYVSRHSRVDPTQFKRISRNTRSGMVHERSAVSTSLEVDNTRKESSPGNDGLELHSDPFVERLDVQV